YPSFNTPSYKNDECVCFVDGLRFDVAKILSEKLKDAGIGMKERIYWTPVPTVTSTCKPALTFISEKFVGDDLHNQDFTPIIKENSQPATTQRIVKLMEDTGWSVLQGHLEKQSKNGWYETGRIDEEGHKIGFRIVYNIESYINDVRDEVTRLFKAGWKSIRLMSDHGWLLMPGGLPKMPMAPSLAESKWGRCAAIKPGALFDGTYYPWYWNENVHFALADGVGCYRNGIEYTHGGISLQECLMVELILRENETAKSELNILITDIVWKGMRCKVAAERDFKGLKVDIRIKPAMAETSIVLESKEFNEYGLASVIVDDDANEGKSTFLVVLDNENKVVYQSITVVGGEA
ncbi:MAG TPA: hypothetical protein VHP38_14275, partial [Ruminiclostridium sp.]|nr:hypothetical protein [Ruminiclostridium sp.]